jgi:hypothetical protein
MTMGPIVRQRRANGKIGPRFAVALAPGSKSEAYHLRSVAGDGRLG